MQISNVNYGYQNTYTQNTANSDKNASLENESTQVVSDPSTENSATTSTEKSEEKDSTGNTKNTQELSVEEQQVVAELVATDAHVRAHEAAHMGAGGGLASPASFTYEKGPDNKMYAVAGEVGISTGEGNTPQETLAKAQQIRRAALAPSDPSPQDLKVAAQAASMEMSARSQIMAEKMAQMQNDQKESAAKTAEQNFGAQSSQNTQNSQDLKNSNTNNPAQNSTFSDTQSKGNSAYMANGAIKIDPSEMF